MNTAFRRSVVAIFLLIAMLFIVSGGLAADRTVRAFTPIADAIDSPSLSTAVPDTVYGNGPKPDHSGDPDDPDKVPPMFLLLLFNRLILIGM